MITIKAITIYQPWASLIACGAKKYETRSWKTDYRGPIAMHAAARKCETRDISARAISAMVQELHSITSKLARSTLYVPFELLPRGSVIATAELVGCWEIFACTSSYRTGYGYVSIGADGGKIISPNGNEMLFGDWTPGRYAWEFANVEMLPEPIPAKGRQRLWEWEMPEDQGYGQNLYLRRIFAERKK